MLENFPLRLSGRQGALPIKSKICLLCRFKRPLSLLKIILVITSVVIQALLFLIFGTPRFCRLSKHYWILLLDSCVYGKCPGKPGLSLACSPPVQRLPFSLRVFSGIPRQNLCVSSMFHMFSVFHPLVISLALSFQLSMVSVLTSLASPGLSCYRYCAGA